MLQVPINRCIGKELRYYGLKAIGLLFALVVGALVLIKFDFTMAIMGSCAGYLLGASISTYWHKGILQKWCYWNLPTQIIASKKLPRSCDRKFL